MTNLCHKLVPMCYMSLYMFIIIYVKAIIVGVNSPLKCSDDDDDDDEGDGELECRLLELVVEGARDEEEEVSGLRSSQPDAWLPVKS